VATRTDARTSVVSILFAWDMGNVGILNNTHEMFEQNKVRNKQRDFGENLLKGTLDHIEAIDSMIESKLKDWDMDRIGKVEKAILRLAIYEMKFTELDKPIAINEALEISKRIGSDEGVSFINGVLDAVKKEL